MSQPKIHNMDNDSNYWAVLSKSSSGGDTGGIDKGHFASAGSSFTFNSDLKIPPNGSDENRMFVQTPVGSWRIWASKDNGDYTISVKGSNNGGDAAIVQTVDASSGQKFELEIQTNGVPKLS